MCSQHKAENVHGSLAFDHGERLDPCHLPADAGTVNDLDDTGNILIRNRSFFGEPAHRTRSHDNAERFKFLT